MKSTPHVRVSAGTMGRPKKTAAERKVKISIAIDADLLKTVEAEAKKNDRSLSSMIVVALREWVGKSRKNT